MLNNKVILKFSKFSKFHSVSFPSANQTLHGTKNIIVKFILFCPVHKYIKQDTTQNYLYCASTTKQHTIQKVVMRLNHLSSIVLFVLSF